MLTFPNKVLLLGFGAVARCTLPILVKHLSLDPTQITILDFEPNEAALKPWIEQGVIFVRDRVAPENLCVRFMRQTGQPLRERKSAMRFMRQEVYASDGTAT
jgi:homospermidine synthase